MIRYATFGRRLWAAILTLLLDLLVLGIMQSIIGGGDVIAPFAMWYLIHHVGLVMEGGTIGHRLAGLRVVRIDGTRVRLPHAVVREVARLFLSIPPLGLGVLWMLDEPQRRTWHDIMGATVVVRERVGADADAPAWADAPPWREATTSAPAADAPDA